MIVSASRRTDIPAFYAPWFAARLRAGWCEVANPFNLHQLSRVSLRREDVDAIVFWTRHARPLFEVLPALGAVVWRYDPILVGSAIPTPRHLETFARIAAGLEGSAQRVVISLVDLYAKTRRRLGRILGWGEDLVEDPSTWAGLDDLLRHLVSIARDHGLQIEACAETRDLTQLGISPTKCIDDRLLAEIYGGSWPGGKDRGQRPACRCIPSRDIGRTDTCSFGCRYCYAIRDAFRRRRPRPACSARSSRAVSLRMSTKVGALVRKYVPKTRVAGLVEVF